nr:MAG TPA: hypothetical protein [Caudoviricetes sp.]
MDLYFFHILLAYYKKRRRCKKHLLQILFYLFKFIH